MSEIDSLVPSKIWGLNKACPCGIYDITLVFILWCCMKVSSCPTLPHSETLLRSCSSSLPSFSLNWKNFLFWRFLSFCQVCMKLDGCSVLFIREGQMEGWMNTDTSSYKPLFQQGQAQRQPLEQGHRSGEGSLLVQYPELSTTPLFLLSEYWNIPCRTAQPFQEGMRMPPSSSSAVSATSEPACSWCGFESPQILSPTFEKRFQSKAFENKQHYPCVCVVFDLLEGIHDPTVILKHQLVSCALLLSFSGLWAWH